MVDLTGDEIKNNIRTNINPFNFSDLKNIEKIRYMLPAKNKRLNAVQLTSAVLNGNSPKGIRYRIVGGGYGQPTFTTSSTNPSKFEKGKWRELKTN